MSLLVIVRHGQSQYNLENRFTGSADPPLTELGRQEAEKAGFLFKADKAGAQYFNIGFTSELKRAIETMTVMLDAIGQPDLPVERNAALNERDYGDLQGLNKTEAEARFGIEQIFHWRRGYADQPPHGESLADVQARMLPYFESTIVPCLQAGKGVLIASHGNTLRALVMHLEAISPEDIEKVELATGVPRQYEYDPATNTFRLLPK
jgi:2,3-bisphosphoglycerate-dependent phosphoglycerate mutase